MRLFMMFCVMLLLAGCDTRTSVERAQEEGVLIVGNNAEPQSFDPHIATSVSDFKIINAVMEGLLRGDSKTRADFYSSGITDGWMLKSEARKLENLPAIEGLDDQPKAAAPSATTAPLPYPSKQKEAAA